MTANVSTWRRMFFAALCLGLLFLALGSMPVSAAPTCTTDCYVDPAGNDANDGASAATPLNSIQLAIDTVNPGGTVHLAAGTYFENAAAGWRELYITKSLTMLGAGSGVTIIELPMKTNGVEIFGANLDVTLEGMTFTKQAANAVAAGFNLRVAEVASSFTNLTFRDIESAYASGRNAFLQGVGTYGAVVVEDSNFHHAGFWGFSIAGPSQSITVDNSHFDNNGDPASTHGIGFDLEASAGSTNVNVSNSSFNNNTGANSKGINLLHTTNAVFDGIEISGNSDGIVIWEWHSTTDNIEIKNSNINGNTRGIVIGSETNKTVNNVKITHNDLSDNNSAGVLIYRAAGWADGVIQDVTINRNNLEGNTFGIQLFEPYEEINGQCNWWGDASGPGPVGPGVGAGVSYGVDFDPWLLTSNLDGQCGPLPPPASFCPAETPGVGAYRTDVYGTGNRGRSAKITLPNYQDMDSLYGQLAAVDIGIMKWVRFSPKNGTMVQVNAPTSPAVVPGTVRWWGADLDPAPLVKGAFFWGPRGNRAPRAFVLWPTYNTGEEQYANAFDTFDSPDNYAYYGSSPIAVQTLTLPATTAEGADITVNVALVDVNRDNRSVILTVEAGGQSQSRVITVPNRKKDLNLETFVLQGVAAGTSEVTITLESPAIGGEYPYGGDSVAMIGASAHYECAVPDSR